ncbi:hypothetical protein [Phenylobacterium sp.]|nr:hypothetical protein [Phenylobacterium sp.]
MFMDGRVKPDHDGVGGALPPPSSFEALRAPQDEGDLTGFSPHTPPSS